MDADDYPPPKDMPADVADVWREVVAAHIEAGDEAIARKVGPGLEAYCSITADLRDATARVSKDGRLVQDVRGNPVEHPGIAIKNNAARELARFGDTYQARRARTRAPRTR